MPGEPMALILHHYAVSIPFSLGKAMPPASDRHALDAELSKLQVETAALGFEAFIYDYSPVPTSIEGDLITPSFLHMERVPPDMQGLWCNDGYYQIDPVQQLALQCCAPFVWSYRHPERTALKALVTKRDRVAEYMNDNDIACGLTVPLHLRDGSFATLTGMKHGQTHEARLEETMAEFSLLAHQFHDRAYSCFGSDARNSSPVSLSSREKECLAYAAEGLTAKQIARQLNRSTATVNLHLNSAIHKLGASNRVQAVVRAIHYRLID
ncbi:LuxR family transcriptional regulator [Salinicola aestuarinus]|uniref:LuxR family transcriptional regulator n=1 Tax=Salinicola aestuarinus TaxID=1949082 RepID=UPI001CB6F111|nr:LuxR family transcriptional regulator [Salinicola aestuarinus]